MFGDFDEDEIEGFETDDCPDLDDMCMDCQRSCSAMDECSICGGTMCSACYEMGCGVCKGPHR